MSHTDGYFSRFGSCCFWLLRWQSPSTKVTYFVIWSHITFYMWNQIPSLWGSPKIVDEPCWPAVLFKRHGYLLKLRSICWNCSDELFQRSLTVQTDVPIYLPISALSPYFPFCVHRECHGAHAGRNGAVHPAAAKQCFYALCADFTVKANAGMWRAHSGKLRKLGWLHDFHGKRTRHQDVRLCVSWDGRSRSWVLVVQKFNRNNLTLGSWKAHPLFSL